MKRISLSCTILMALVILILIIPVISEQPLNPLALREITSDEDFKIYIENLTSQYKSTYYGVETDYVGKDMIVQEASSQKTNEMKLSAPVSAVSTSRSGAADYSSTNIQVAGVDEADFVKNDGKYIYMVSDNTLSIIQAFPPQTASIVAKESVSGTVTDLFLANDRLVVFTSDSDYPIYKTKSDYSRPISGERTYALVYDISERTHPQKIRELSTPGRYEHARMIGGDVYVLTADSWGYYNPRMPVIYDDLLEIKVDSVWCPPTIVNEYRMNTLTSFPVTGSGSPQAISFLLGSDTTLYVSPTDVFIAYEKENYGWNRPFMEEERFSPAQTLSPDQESVIHRFAIDRGSIRYKSTGTIPGSLLNQFSLDQYDGNLRAATTVEDQMYSNVYVLNPDLNIIGKVEHLAPGEKIYSARFMGELLYLVTFKQTDPLFVIDLSNPNQPEILGKLKIPGYSDYLHPYDRTHLIGIGKDTYENSGGGVIPTGVKIALFDVSDLNNPRVIDSRVIGEKGSDSAVLTDHRAFLFDKEKNIMVLPIKEVIHSLVPGSKYDGSYTERVWQGAYVFGIDPDRGFIEKGRILQNPDSGDLSWESGSMVLRSVFMDQVLYTISRNEIIGSDLQDLSKRLMKIDLIRTPKDPWYLRPLWSSLGE